MTEDDVQRIVLALQIAADRGRLDRAVRVLLRELGHDVVLADTQLSARLQSELLSRHTVGASSADTGPPTSRA